MVFGRTIDVVLTDLFIDSKIRGKNLKSS